MKHETKTGDARPVRKQPYRLAHSLEPIIEEQGIDMLKKGIIVESSSPWNYPSVMIKNMNNGTSKRDRLCVDPRGLNALTKLDFTPLQI